MIRFKKDDGTEYEKQRGTILKEVYNFQYGQFNNNPDNGGEYPIYGANGIIGGYNEYNAEKSVIIGHMGSNAGSILWEEGKHFVTYNGTIATPKDDNIFNAKYGYYLLLSKNILKICAGSGQPFLSYDTLNKIKISLHESVEEQQKIAVFLSAVDDVITASEKEVANLEEQKKGVMQKIFSQEVRFKADDGSDYPAWEEKKLGECCELITKGTTPKEYSENSEINFVRIDSIEDGKINPNKCLKIDNEIHSKVLARSILRENDILCSIAGALGVTAIVTKEILPANTNQALAILRLKSNENKEFIVKILDSNIMEKYIRACKTVGAQPNLSLAQMNGFVIPYPCLEEQQKIADFLSDMDTAIDLAKQELEQWKELKKGLLQQLFE